MRQVVVVSSHLRGETAATSRHPVHAVECVADTDYMHGIADAWDSDATVVNIEHDVQYDDALIDALVNCPHPACAYPYLIHHTGRPAFYCCATGDRSLHWPGFWATCAWVTPGVEWADFAAPGFIKVHPSVRQPFTDIEQPWTWVEMAVNEHVDSRWHLHWPAVEHYHR